MVTQFNLRKGWLFLIFEFMDKNLLEIIEEHEEGIPEEMIWEFVY